MAKTKKIVRQSEITRYIYSCILHCDSEVPVPLSELELAERFGTTRLTIQRALSRFVENETLIRLPRRRGLFINPEAAKQMDSYLLIGILSADHQSSFLDYGSQGVICGFADGMQEFSCDYHYMNLESEKPQDIVAEIMNSGLDGLLWLTPNDSDIPVINELIRRECPVAVISSLHNSWQKVPDSNYIRFDFEKMGVLRADYVRKQGWRRVLYYGEGTTYDFFLNSLPAEDRNFTDRHHLDYTADLVEVLSETASRTAFDGIVADGRIYSLIAKLYQEVPQFRTIPLLLDAVPRLQQIRKQYPDLRIHAIPYSFPATQRKIGRRAAFHLQRIMNGPYVFEPESVGMCKGTGMPGRQEKN